VRSSPRHCEEERSDDEAIQPRAKRAINEALLSRACRRAAGLLRHRRREATPFFERLWLAMTLKVLAHFSQ
jgi:hypothetical protein